MHQKRSSGILAHVTSLPSPYGIGDIGDSSKRFIEFLVESGQSYWQFLPTGPTNAIFDYSPYMSTSAFAGSFLLISLEQLRRDGLLNDISTDSSQTFSIYQADYEAVEVFKKKMLKKAFEQFDSVHFGDYQNFIESSIWLDDYAVFMAAKETYANTPWYSWPGKLAEYDMPAVQAFRLAHKNLIDYFYFEQYIFHSQWQRLRAFASENRILLFGDLPIYVSLDSVDVWANQELFCLDTKSHRPTHVSGVPPDYFSTTGQRWGNPLYDWQNRSQHVQSALVDWWAKRLAHLFKQVDTARIDHFRAFESYWAIPEENETAIEGQWLKGPGKAFFNKIFQILGPLEIIAEDLGIITQEVEQLRDELGFPGMKVLQFAFDNNLDNSFLPHNFTTSNCVVYTGTHDNDTTLGWYLSDKLDDTLRAEIKKLANRTLHDKHGIHNDLIYMAMSSIARITIIPLQDVLGFGGDCKMNTPGTSKGNWRWRCASQFLTEHIAAELSRTAKRFNRARSTQDAQYIRPEANK